VKPIDEIGLKERKAKTDNQKKQEFGKSPK